MTTQYSMTEPLECALDEAVDKRGFVSKSELVRHSTRVWLENHGFEVAKCESDLPTLTGGEPDDTEE